MTAKVDLSAYKSDLNIEAGILTQILWYYINAWIFNSYILPFYGIKRYLLKLFGAKIGKGVVIKPKVNVKYPWKLSIGDFSWIGENVWIDNLDEVKIGSNVVISQGALLLSGNHNYKSKSFDLITGKIILEDGVWIGARALVTGNVVCASHAVLSVNSVASQNLAPYTIYSGNPCTAIRKRKIQAMSEK